jgi:uncharacterized Zn finger protein
MVCPLGEITMPTTPILNEYIIRNLAGSESFERGQDYFHAGAVRHIERRENTLLADVEGSSPQPYRVTVAMDAGGITDVDCTCPYEYGGACKHIVAVLLAYIEKPHQIEERPSIDTVLSGLDHATLRDLIKAMVARQPDLVEWLEGELALRTHLPSPDRTPRPPYQRATPLDTGALSRQIRQAKRAFEHDDFYQVSDSSLMQTLTALLEKAHQFVEAGDAHSGLQILAVMAEEMVVDWHEYDHDGDAFALFFEELGELLAEAILTAELSQEEREAWAERVTEWQGGIDDYAMEINSFDAAIGAAIQGWDSNSLQRALQGETEEQDVSEDSSPWYAATLLKIRLKVLERQGRTTEYLNLARATRKTAHYLTMLVKLGRVQEAVDVGLESLQAAHTALILAQQLREQMRFAEALQIGEHGLTLKGDKSELARWLRDFAAAQGKLELALQAAQIAFTESLTLATYQAVEPLAGNGWPSVKQELLAVLKEKEYAYEQIDIYLYEEMIDEAVKAVDANSFIGYYTIERVVDAALATHSDWAIRQCRRQAEPIMDRGKSNAYHHALRWLPTGSQVANKSGRAISRASLTSIAVNTHWRLA